MISIGLASSFRGKLVLAVAPHDTSGQGLPDWNVSIQQRQRRIVPVFQRDDEQQQLVQATADQQLGKLRGCRKY